MTGMSIPAMAGEANEAANTRGTQQPAAVEEEQQATDAAEPSFVMATTEAANAVAAELPENDELLMDYMEQEVSVSSEARASQYGRNHLTGTNLQIYNILRKNIEQVADGTRTGTEFTISIKDDLKLDQGYTAKELGVNVIVSNGIITQNAMNALKEKFFYDFELQKIMNALLFDCPAELYWYNKIIGTLGAFTYGYTVKNGKLYFSGSAKLVFRMTVAAEYAAGTYETSNSTIDTVQNAIQNARNIVKEKADLGDREKLLAYKNAICEAVSYNYDAAKDNTNSYGNPWQMIWVFDGDPDTTVVCEGYSKAFQFLCDVSEFQSENVSCRIVSGKMGDPDSGGGHMWNLVTLEDGRNYLADVTNSDAGTVGSGGQLFLSGLEECTSMSSATDPFKVYTIFYRYDGETLLNYTEEELLVADGHKWGTEQIENTTEADCVTPAGYEKVVYCTKCRAELSRTFVETVPAHGHHFTNYVSDQNASCTIPGTKTAKCDQCEATDTIKEEGSAPGHMLQHFAAKASTTTVQGNIEYWKCSVCKRVFKDGKGIVQIRESSVKTPLLKSIVKKANPLTVKAKKTAAVKASKVKKKAQTIKRKKAITVSGAQGTVTFLKKKGNKKIKVSANGTITVKKGLKKGDYPIVIRVKAAGNTYYNAGYKNVKVIIHVK